MARTTVDIDTPILNELKQLQKSEHRSLGQLVSQLLAEALNSRKQPKQTSSLNWVSQSMQARVDLADKEAVYAALDEDTL
ncbi:antitoxin [Nitrospira sp. M1]